MLVNAQNLRTLQVGYSAAYQKAFDSQETNYERIATVIPSSTREQTYGWLGQMPQMREWIGEREIQNLSAYDYTIKNKHFEMTIGVNRDDIEDDVYGSYTPMFQNLGECAALHPDEQVFSILQEGFENKCYDGKEFFSTQHKVNGKNVSNKSTYELSEKSYGAARADMMMFKGDKEKSLKILPDLLVVPPTLEEKARRILKADYIDGTSNIYKDTADILVVPELTDSKKWYLLCTKKALKPIIYQERKKIKFVSMVNETDEKVFMNNEFQYGADGRNNTGYGFWQMAIGSTGEETYPE